MNIVEKFDRGITNHTYQRIDSEYKVNIFLGYNDDGQMSMVITEAGKAVPVKSSKFINVTIKKREDGKLALSFDLIDGAYKSLFLIFCKDIIVTCEKAGTSMAISSAIVRWKYWKEMFGKRKATVLDKLAVKGLIGELLELKDHFIADYGQDKAISSWMGPLLGHKDFEIEDTWYEVKAVNENAVQVAISSLEQLDANVDGHLVIVRLEDTSTVNSLAINLNSIVLEITNLIEDPDTMALFRIRLDNMGYVWDEEYNNYNFLYKGTERYSVTEKFPCLRRRDVDGAIGNVKYTILLNAISSFKEV